MSEEKPKEAKPEAPSPQPKEAPKPEASKQEKPKEASKPEAPKATEKPKQEAPKEEKPAAVAAGQKKTKKINKMTMKELDKQLEDVQQKMGNMKSKYALMLLKRKRELVDE